MRSTPTDRTTYHSELKLATEAAVDVGAMLLERFSEPDSYRVDVKESGVNNLVTEMDLLAERRLREMLEGKADATFLGEESGGLLPSSGRCWVVDPIDGTVNYARGIPNWCVSVGLVEEGRPVVGVIVDPNRGEVFSAAAGSGASRNGEVLGVSNVSDIGTSLLITGFPYEIAENPHGAIDAFSRVISRGIAVRRLGSAALDLAWLASGRFDGFWEVALQPWDVAAGILIANEAGGRISSYATSFEESVSTDRVIIDRVIATNGLIDRELFALLRGE